MIMVFWAQVSWTASTKGDYLHQEKITPLNNTDVCWFRNPFSHLFDKYFDKQRINSSFLILIMVTEFNQGPWRESVWK